jgi:exopolysaccharide production protein ExoQ
MTTVSSFLVSPGAETARERTAMIFPGAIGFFFIFRVSFIYLFFQENPLLGTKLSMAIDLSVLFGTILYTVGGGSYRGRWFQQAPPLRWMLALVALSAASLCWTGAQSFVAAFGYWLGMTIDVLIILLLHQDLTDSEAIMKGAVWGGVGLAIIGWCSPVTVDLRLGNDEFLHPNTLGLELGITALIAQYFAARSTLWKWLGILLAITLLRTLSKTAIVAFVIAECWYLMQSRGLARKAKLQLGAATLLVVASFWGLLNTYVTTYNNTGSGSQVETLTGRTILWTVAFSMSMERPWFGHGVYSFKSLIPALGPFAAVHAHNELLQQFFEYGLAGVVIVVGLYLSLLRQAQHVLVSEMRTLALALLIFTLLRGLADTVPIGLSYHLWLMAVLSVCLARPQQAEITT